jgi:tRNA-dihydrouridine synthase B
MGCQRQKIHNVHAGSTPAERAAGRRSSCRWSSAIPVTLKIRTGWNKDNRNALAIARIAQENGIQSLAMHGRTRACMYNGDAEYETIRAVKQSVSIPVIANGDIDTPEKAKFVLEYTGADGS